MAAWIESLLAPGESMRAFAKANGLDDARISTWRRGGEPSIENLRATADALHVPFAKVLIESGWGSEDDFTVTEAPPGVPDVDGAIENDPRLGPPDSEQRAALRHIRAAFTASETAPKQRAYKVKPAAHRGA